MRVVDCSTSERSTESARPGSPNSDTATGIYTRAIERGNTQLLRPNIEQLVGRAKRGEAAAFEQLARCCLRPAYSVALAIVRRPSDAEDVAQDALLTAFERLVTCREPDRFMAWVLTIVRNLSRNLLERRRLRDVLPSEPTTETSAPEIDMDGGLERGRLLEALGALNEAEREVVLLHDLEGFTHQEISESLDISCVMSRQHLFVARRKMRAVLQDAVFEGNAND